MTNNVSQQIVDLNKTLMKKILTVKETSGKFKRTEKQILTSISRSDSLYFGSQTELDRIIESVANKFILHGYIAQSKEFKRLYQFFTRSGSISKQELCVRLNVVKFLLDMAISPTNNLEYVSQTVCDKGDAEDTIVDWGAYLREGIPEWRPNYDDGDSTEWSEEEGDLNDQEPTVIEKHEVDGRQNNLPTFPNINSSMQVVTYGTFLESKEKLLKSVQSKWFEKDDKTSFKPASNDEEANMAILWEDHINFLTGGLLPTHNVQIVSEYQVLREVIWQLYNPHNGCCFHFSGDNFIPKDGVTIASVREAPFRDFLSTFVPYIEQLATLNDFHKSVSNFEGDTGQPDVGLIPDTYRGYNFAIRTIVEPIYEHLNSIENKIQAQNETYTLLTLAKELEPLFQPIKIINKIHQKSVPDFENNSPAKCVTNLLNRLHEYLAATSSKLEQDICLTLYMHSLYKYMSIIDSWLVRDILHDQKDEFIISDNGNQGWQIKYIVKEIDESTKSNHIVEAICTQVLQIGKNVHMLRLLRKLHLLTEQTGKHEETLYEIFNKRVFENISDFFSKNFASSSATESSLTTQDSSTNSYVFPVICPDDCKYLTEMDKLENLVDTSNGFLMKAFESFFFKDKHVETCETPLFEKISQLTKGLFPVRQIVDHIFSDILSEKFSVSGPILKSVLVDDYRLEKQFMFLKSIFLFKDDLIFPLYRRIFEQISSGGAWGNHTWLTSQLQDTIMDAYPQFYAECTVEVKDSWRICTDPLEACDMINIHYRLDWPVNVIILKEHMTMYRDLFGFILKLKWALYTLNHLYFQDLRRKGKGIRMQPIVVRSEILKLETLRFGLINTLSGVHHYILGHVYSKHSGEFERAFECASDLDSLTKAHNNFVESLHDVCISFAEYKQSQCGFYMLLFLVRTLKNMWANLENVKEEELSDCQILYLECHQVLDPIINPTKCLF